MKRADRLAARVTLIVGGDELARGEVTLRDMRDRRAARRAARGRRRARRGALLESDGHGTMTEFSYRTHTCGELRAARRRPVASCCSAGCIASAISAALMFFDLRDRYGMTQVVVRDAAARRRTLASSVRPEFVVAVDGPVERAVGRGGQPEARDRARSRSWPTRSRS